MKKLSYPVLVSVPVPISIHLEHISEIFGFFQVAVAHTIGHVAATVSMSKVAVSFTHIIKSGEPAFSVLVSRFLLGEAFPMPVYLSLVPIIGGCALAAVTELNFNMTGKSPYSVKITCQHFKSHLGDCIFCNVDYKSWR